LPSRLAVRFRRIELDATLEAADGGDSPREIGNRPFLARADVDGIAAVVALTRQQDRVDNILDIEELPRRRAVTPDFDPIGSLFHRLDTLLDQGGNDVRRPWIEVVARSVQ